MFSKFQKEEKGEQKTSEADVTATMKMFSTFLLEKDNQSTAESDSDDSVVVENGPLASVDIKPTEFKSNIMLIQVPEHLRSPSDPHYQFATIDRSIPGNTDLKGNAVLDKLYPNLPKVTPFEEPKPQEEDITPPRKRVVSEERPKPPQANCSNARGRMRQNHRNPPLDKSYRKPDWKPTREINPWMPGAEPYEKNLPNVPLMTKKGSRNLTEYPDVVRRPVNDGYGPNRETLPYKHPVSLSDGPISNFSAGYDGGIPPGYSGDFNDGLQPRYSKDFVNVPPPSYSEDFDGVPPPSYPENFGGVPPPSYSENFGGVPPPVYPDSYSDGPPRSRYSSGLLRTPQNKYKKPTQHFFGGCMNARGRRPMNSSYPEGPRDTGMNYRTLNSSDPGHYQNKQNFNSKNYPRRGHHNAQSGTFQNAGGKNYVENRPRGTRPKRFRRRSRQNF